MAFCRQCDGKHFDILERRGGLCKRCFNARSLGEPLALPVIKPDASHIVLTTETAHDLPVAQRLDIISAEVVIGLHFFKDLFSAYRDTFGGRSKTMQDALRDARHTAQEELRQNALEVGADAVVGVSLCYSEVSGRGKSMLFLVASGTAVTLKPDARALQ